jgi:hypothetical protein
LASRCCAALVSLLAGVQAVATLGTGFLVDRDEPRHLVPVAMLMLSLASALPAFGSGIAISMLYAFSLGGAYGSQNSLMRWDENYHLFILGAWSFACAWMGRSALRHPWRFRHPRSLSNRPTLFASA